MLPATIPVYIYAWGNNSRRAELKGRRCVIVASGKMNTVLIRFLDTNEKVTTSYRALREEKDDRQANQTVLQDDSAQGSDH